MSAATLYAARVAAGECVDCEDVPEPGKRRCAACAKRKAAGVEAARQRRIAAGTCSRCPEPPSPGSELCVEHLEAHRDASAAYWTRRAA